MKHRDTVVLHVRFDVQQCAQASEDDSAGLNHLLAAQDGRLEVRAEEVVPAVVPDAVCSPQETEPEVA